VLLFAAAAGVLALEILVLSLRFDVGTLGDASGWPAALLRQGPLLVRLAVTSGVAVLLFCGRQLRCELSAPGEAGTAGGVRLALLLGAHAAALACVYVLTGVLLGGGTRGPDPSPGWFLAWAASGVAAAATLGLAVLPAGRWFRLAARLWPSLLVAAVVGLLAWGGGLVSARLWEPLGRSTLWAAHGLLRLWSGPVVYNPDESTVGTESFEVEVAPQCSGYEGVGLTLAFVAGDLWLCRHALRFPHALLLLPLGAALAWAANAVRIAALVQIGTWGARDVAAGGFHSQAGWLAFNAVALGLVAYAHRSRLFSLRPARSRAGPSAAYLVPFLVLVATSMVTAAFEAGPDRLYPVRVVTVGAALGYFRKSYPAPRWSWVAAGIGLAVAGIWALCAPAAADAPADAGLTGLPAGWAALWVVFRLAGSCLTAPLAEELAFRGYLTRRLIAARFEEVPAGEFTWPSFLISSVLFGALHGRWLAGTVAGAAYALALYRRRELSDAVLAHAVTNAALDAYALGAGRPALLR
jgi:exosortase E/protease (VPEID-CTERM system)